MNTSDFYYSLPEELIAQTPLERRDASRLLTLDRSSGGIGHEHFYDLPGLLRPGDCLVLNDSRVLPARLFGETVTGAVIEVVLLRDLGEGRWECLTRPGRRTKAGTRIVFAGGELRGTVLEAVEGGNRIIEFEYSGIFLETLERIGTMPLPPYIRERLSDPERYQTVYSRESGSAAAPTAGLHFTEELIKRLEGRGVGICFVTLHVGLGTFRPVKVKNFTDHNMHAEYCEISQKTAEMITKTRADGGRVICVGTTSCRTLESFAKEDGALEKSSGWTDIFIYPGYRFRVTDGLITNFHLPESTLIMLVSAFAGRECVLDAYEQAVREGYRFFSFGDAMFIS